MLIITSKTSTKTGQSYLILNVINFGDRMALAGSGNTTSHYKKNEVYTDLKNIRDALKSEINLEKLTDEVIDSLSFGDAMELYVDLKDYRTYKTMMQLTEKNIPYKINKILDGR